MVSSIVNFFLFRPPEPKIPYAIPNEIIRLQTARGNEIAATYIDRKSTITILFSHGNAEDLNSCFPFLHQLSILLDVNVVGYDFSGYGESTGKLRVCLLAIRFDSLIMAETEKSLTTRFFSIT
jgi:pimeloyl-ACP methyl ester carboxylesterase